MPHILPSCCLQIGCHLVCPLIPLAAGALVERGCGPPVIPFTQGNLQDVERLQGVTGPGGAITGHPMTHQACHLTSTLLNLTLYGTSVQRWCMPTQDRFSMHSRGFGSQEGA